MKSYQIYVLLLTVGLSVCSLLQAQQVNPFDSKKKTEIGSPTIDVPLLEVKGSDISNSPFVKEYNPLPFLGRGMSAAQRPGSELSFDENSSVPIFARGPHLESMPVLESDEQATAMAYEYLEEIKTDLGIKAPLEEFAFRESIRDQKGNLHLRFQQMCGQYEVHASDIVVHLLSDGKRMVNGRFHHSATDRQFVAELSEAEIQEILQTDLESQTKVTELCDHAKDMMHYHGPESKLVVYYKKGYVSVPTLAYYVVARPNFLERWEYIVDAVTGEILQEINSTCEAGPTTATDTDLNGDSRTLQVYEDGGTYIMLDVTKDMYSGPGASLPDLGDGLILTYDMQNNSPNSGANIQPVTSNNNNWDAKEVSAHWNASRAFDYFKNTFGRNSIDGDGGDVYSFINVADQNGSSMDNAFWNGVGIYYGNGAQAFTPLAGGLDVAGHEMSHGVVEHTANLEYQYESGALNESFADIFGAMIDRDDWKIGEDIVNSSVFPSGAMRDMQNPHNGGTSFNNFYYQPEKVSEKYTGSQDNGGVHLNSGIPNHAFYLFATNVGKDKAEDTFYKALQQYLTRSSQFIDLRLAVLQSCEDLYGAGSSELNAAINAFDQVEIFGPNTGNGGGSGDVSDLEENPGQEYIVFTDTNGNDPVTMYVTNAEASEFIPITQTPHSRRISMSDDGTLGVFVDDEGHIRLVNMNLDNPQETVISTDAEWDNVAISKDGRLIAAVPNYVDPNIYVYDISGETVVAASFELSNPTSAEGISTGEVKYADAIEFDHTGEYVMYDAYNEISTSQWDQNLDFWDVGWLKVWDKNTGNFADGNIIKLFSGLEEGVSLGNGVFSKNSPYIIAFDYFDFANDVQVVLGANIETSDIQEIHNNDRLGYPNYSIDDSQLLFNSSQGGEDYIFRVGLQDNKIQATGSPQTFINAAQNGVWFANGTRNLEVANESLANDFPVEVFPNPFSNKLTLNFLLEKAGPVSINVMDLQGRIVLAQASEQLTGQVQFDLQLENVPHGMYILELQTAAGKNARLITKVQ